MIAGGSIKQMLNIWLRFNKAGRGALCLLCPAPTTDNNQNVHIIQKVFVDESFSGCLPNNARAIALRTNTR